MSNAESPDDALLPLHVEQRIDDLCCRFEQQWAEQTAPQIDDYLADDLLGGNVAWQRALLVELTMLDLEYRWRDERVAPHARDDQRLGLRPRLEDYLALWPQLGPAETLPVELVAQEYRVRRLAGHAPSVREYAERFAGMPGLADQLRRVDRRIEGTVPRAHEPTAAHRTAPSDGELEIRCPYCHSAMSVGADAPLSDLSCHTCGSNFSVVGHEEDDTGGPHPPQIARFEFIEHLGGGGFGNVWRARDRQLDREVAVKIPRRERLGPVETEQFLREARAAAQLRHPHIVGIHEVGRADDVVFIISDFVRGRPLSQRLDQGPLPQREAARLCAEVAEAVHHAHQRGVVHRDLKPANMMLDDDDRPHVMDFGLAKRDVGEMTMTVDGRIMGTPAYMSPEQARGEGHYADCRTDVYSLGVVLFECLTGQLPFRGSTQMIIAQILADEPPSPRRLDRTIARDLETICLRCLEKQSAARYADARQLADELHRYLRGEPIHARPVGVPGRAWRWCKRKPVVATLAGLLTFIVLLLAAGAPPVAWYQAGLRRQAEETSEDLQESLDLQQRQLRQINALRLAAEAKNLVDEYPQRALLLAAEAIGRAGDDDAEQDTTLSTAHQALRDVLARVSGRGFGGHDAAITCLAAAADADCLVTADREGGALAWYWAADGELGSPTSLAGHRGGVHDAAVASDGRQALTAGSDGSVRLWKLGGDTPECVVLRSEGVAVRSVALGGDGHWATAGDDEGGVSLWDLMASEPAASLQRLAGPTQRIRCVAIRPDGQWLAAAGDDATVWLWNLSDTAAPPRQLTGHDGFIHVVRFSPDNRYLATAGRDTIVRLWPLDALHESSGATGVSPVQRRGGAGGLSARVANPMPGGMDGLSARVAKPRPGGTDGLSARVAKPRPGGMDGLSARVAKPRPGGTGGLSARVVGPRVSAAFTGGQAASATQFVSVPEAITPGATAGLSSSARSGQPNGAHPRLRFGLVSANASRFVTVPEAIAPIELPGHRGAVRDLALSDDGRWLASAGTDGAARLWRLDDPARIAATERVLTGHERIVRRVAFRRDGGQLATAGEDGTIRLWNLDATDPAAEPIVLRGHEATVAGVTYCSGRDVLVSVGSDTQMRLWNPGRADAAANPLALRTPGVAIRCVAIDRDRRRLLAGVEDGTVRRWQLDAARIAATPLPSLAGHDQAVCAVAVSCDGQWMATGGEDATVRVVKLGDDAAEHSPIVLAGHEQRVAAVAFDMLHGRLLTAGWNGRLLAWPLGAHGPQPDAAVRIDCPAAILCLAVSADGRHLVAGCEDRAVRIWNLEQLADEAEPTVLPGHRVPVVSVAVTPDRRWVLAGNFYGEVYRWNLQLADPGGISRPLRAHQEAVTAMTVSPDGRWLITGSADRSVRLWDLTLGDPGGKPTVLAGHGGTVNALAVTADGRDLISAAADGTLRTWPLPLSRLIETARQTAGRELTDLEKRQYLLETETP